MKKGPTNLLRYGVIGYGYWGPNLVRNFVRAVDSSVVAIADGDAGQRKRAAAEHPGIQIYNDARELIACSAIDVVAIATPVRTHYPLAKAALQAGKHVFVEKPFTAQAQHAEELIDLAAQKNLQIFVDHTFVYTGAVRKIKQVITNGDLGKVIYYDSVRINLGLFQHDVNVLWDLAVHDLAILDYLLVEKPTAVSTIAIDPVGAQPASIGYLTLYYDTRVIAHIHGSWLSPVKLRRTLIGGDQRMILYDDLEPSEKVRIYDKGIQFVDSAEEERRLKVDYRSGDMLAPHLNQSEALAIAAQHANESILRGIQPTTCGEVGLRIVKILEASDKSASNRGQIVGIEL